MRTYSRRAPHMLSDAAYYLQSRLTDLQPCDPQVNGKRGLNPLTRAQSPRHDAPSAWLADTAITRLAWSCSARYVRSHSPLRGVVHASLRTSASSAFARFSAASA